MGHRPGERGGIELAYAGLEVGLQVGDFLGNLPPSALLYEPHTIRRQHIPSPRVRYILYLPARVCVAWPPGGDFSVTSVGPSNYPATRRG